MNSIREKFPSLIDANISGFQSSESFPTATPVSLLDSSSAAPRKRRCRVTKSDYVEIFRWRFLYNHSYSMISRVAFGGELTKSTIARACQKLRENFKIPPNQKINRTKKLKKMNEIQFNEIHYDTQAESILNEIQEEFRCQSQFTNEINNLNNIFYPEIPTEIMPKLNFLNENYLNLETNIDQESIVSYISSNHSSSSIISSEINNLIDENSDYSSSLSLSLPLIENEKSIFY